MTSVSNSVPGKDPLALRHSSPLAPGMETGKMVRNTRIWGYRIFNVQKKYTYKLYKYVHNQYPIISPSISDFRVVMFLCGLVLNSLRHGRRPQAHVLERKGHADAGCIVPGVRCIGDKSIKFVTSP